MKKLLLLLPIVVTGCLGQSAKNNEMIGQVKKIMHNTPFFLPDYLDADISLGIIRGGVGSMSSQDKWVYVPNEKDFEILKKANESGKLVKITYQTERFRFYVHNDEVIKVEILD